MAKLDALLEEAWRTRQAHFPPVLGADNPRHTRAVSLTGTACALDCAHCGRHYLGAMLPAETLEPSHPRLAGAASLLISGGCDAQGRVPVTAHLERIHAVRPGRRLNWHTGLIGEPELRAIAGLVDLVSFDLVGDDATIAEVYGLEATVADYRAAYRRLRQAVRVVPHITIGLRGGEISGERAALKVLREEGAEAIVFLVLIPTPGTRYAGRIPPDPEEVARLLAEARIAFPQTPLLLGCMRPGGAYRQALDPLAVRAGINRIVKPSRAALEYARRSGLEIERGAECCVLSLEAGTGTRACPTPIEAAGKAPLPSLSPTSATAAANASPRPPSRVRVSAGTEVVLGLRQRPMQAAPTTAYLMLDGGGCAMACSFCAQSRGSEARADALSRVIWPEYPLPTVVEALRDGALQDAASTLRRVCFQVTLHPGALEETLAAVREVRRVTRRPISVAIRPSGLEGVAALLEAGVDAVGLGLDCATEAVYRAIKGAGWSKMVSLVEAACRRFPGRVRVHLMVGLGETEEEFCRTLQQVYDWGGAVGLFAFTPVRGTPLAGRPQPPLDAYRRMQVGRFLVHHGLARVEQFRFAAGGRLVSFGRPDLAALLADGEALRTSGCPGCNRPYYNERPGRSMYNYPRPLTAEEAQQALEELGLRVEDGGAGGKREVEKK